ncbi:hypothetical protein [Bradyrhizobium cenepequi]|uniref:hypothetical protein n=1 Tax=Bradyrhizobium cenepequi TaxID=2821403 RepID=UPI001CE30A48|nr:hypothetical protein [Bradyrhizobium cenepequi]MCA6107718.1 hypothetical protein [Bradyrhizobium cenepequi]
MPTSPKAWRHAIKYVADSLYADPEKAVRRLMKIADAVEPWKIMSEPAFLAKSATY